MVFRTLGRIISSENKLMGNKRISDFSSLQEECKEGVGNNYCLSTGSWWSERKHPDWSPGLLWSLSANLRPIEPTPGTSWRGLWGESVVQTSYPNGGPGVGCFRNKINEEGQSAFQSYVGQLTALADLMRPDLTFITKQMATKQNNASKSDMRSVRILRMNLKNSSFLT